MSSGGHTRLCSQCQKHVYDLAALEAREIEALVEATQGRFCARITRDRFGRMITREPDTPTFPLPAALSVRRASPVVAAVVTAVVGLSGAGWAEAPPVSAPIAASVAGESAAPDPAYPAEPGGATLDGRVVDDHGVPLPGATIVVIHPEEGWRLVAVGDAQGRFQFRDIPRGIYDIEIELEGFDFKNVAGLKLGRRGRQITFTGTMAETARITVTMGETWRPMALPLDEVLRQSSLRS
jgi:Carboxypeptidase regulatory-like domain